MGAASTTPVTDSTHTVAVASDDEISISVVSAGTSGAITLRQIAVWLKPLPERALSDSITISEPSMIRRLAKPRSSGAETVTISETRNRINGAVRPMAAQTIPISDGVIRATVHPGTVAIKTLSETTVISETKTRLKAVWRYQP